MAGSFELIKARDGCYFYHLKAGNGEVILTGTLQSDKATAREGIEAVRRQAARDAAFERMISVRGDPYFVLRAGASDIVGTSEMYAEPAAMEKGIASVKQNAPLATVRDQT